MSDAALVGRWVLAIILCIGGFSVAIFISAFMTGLLTGEQAYGAAYLGGTASGIYGGVLLGASQLPPPNRKTAVFALSLAMAMLVALGVLGNFMMQHADRALYQAAGGVIGFVWLSQRDRFKPRPLAFDDEDISTPINPAPAAPAMAVPQASSSVRRAPAPKSFGKRR